MPEYQHTETRWRCDFCSRDVKKGVANPPGWHETRSRHYGSSLVCCPDCVGRLKAFCEQEDTSFPLPAGLE